MLRSRPWSDRRPRSGPGRRSRPGPPPRAGHGRHAVDGLPAADGLERTWRHPIKSTGGERLESVGVDEPGLLGDRLYAVRDAEGRFGSGKNTRRFRRMPGLLRLGSR
ncbi:MOSC N-terminal beta barrel domain-containing protein [Streptomyces sp. NPDC002553]|uniref:MOSC N-terminal beta barrel domain-containing protein n=1 Tax=Streptomyces sp. NPDC002553 TaxID=3154417 RepID=UPI003331BB66